MGGRIWIESSENKGTIIRFTVPILDPATADANPAEQPSGPRKVQTPGRSPFEMFRADPESATNTGARVLLVEDNLVNQKVAKLTLERLGYQVDIAGDGFQAIEAAENGNYEIICMDVSMPGMDGIEATRRIRRLDSKTAKAKIVAMTGHAFVEDRNRCLDAGMDHFISKPFDLFELKQTLDEVICKPAAEPVLEPAAYNRTTRLTA